MSGSETVAPSPSESNAPAASESCEASPFETNPPSPQSQPSGAGASSSKRVRGPTVGKATAKRIADNNGNKLYIPITETFNAFEGVLATPGSNEIGLQIRRMCPIQGVKSWTVAEPATKAAVVQAVRDKFEIGDNYEDNSLSQKVVEKKCYVLYKDWKCRMKKKLEKLVDAGIDPYAHPYKGVQSDDWKYLIDQVWLDPKNKPRYDAGKLNRSKLPYNHSSGSRSFPAAMNIAVKENGGLLPDICNFYKNTHQNKKTKEWIDPICCDLHEQMTMVRDESIESGTPMTQEDISRVVLGKKKGYLRGFGVGPKPSSCDVGSNVASQAREEHLKRLTSELEILRAEQQSDREEQKKKEEEQQKKEEEQQMKEAENARQREEMQMQIFGLQSTLAQVLEKLNPSKSPP
ncbi:unnamed protein product [Camellia sinensis]